MPQSSPSNPHRTRVQRPRPAATASDPRPTSVHRAPPPATPANPVAALARRLQLVVERIGDLAAETEALGERLEGLEGRLADLEMAQAEAEESCGR